MATTPRNVRTPGASQAAAPKPNTQPLERTPTTAAGEGGTELPNAVDVNPRALRAPVLTNQGWICPDEDWQKKHAAEFQAMLDAQD
ncbi:hypothetical protein CDN99_06600 [Roseateles aquatilis]|uniref:Uncharacterized protein n=1 Tax=Roseateles aquatilis TaxID=431061 RepID=A0A246JHJ1_9BURK|nr:hypothetical protein [Roseateles aquatilis]OWQ92022.1 hypothetical protein CDN99_06600 [Roseateles aquatilis]